MIRKQIKLVGIIIIMLMVGCVNGPKINVDSLDIEIPELWQTEIPNSNDFTGEWWKVFEDDKLEKFILNFQKSSPDLQSIFDNRNIAYQSSKINSAGIFPSFNGNVRVDTSVQNLTGFGEAGNNIFGGEPGEVISFGNSTAGLGLNFQWELDIWGRILNGRKAAQKNYEAIDYDLSYLGFSSIIRATQLYFQAVEAYGQMVIAQESYLSLVEIRDLVKDRYERGLKSSLDFRLAETSVLTSKVSMESRYLQSTNLNRKLKILIGEYPNGELITKVSLPVSMPNINSIIPAQLITRRPDIKSLFLKAEAEGLLLAQAKRNLLPGISLSGTVGTSAQKLEDIFNDDYGIWTVGAAVTAPIFSGGRLRAAAKLQESSQKISKKELLKGLLDAFFEVEQLLELEKSLLLQQEAIQSAVNQSMDAYNLSKERYDKGVTILESVLNTQRQYNNIRSQYISLSRQRIDNRLSLFLALGGDSN
jgi:NodT family efflux transporter outer membrane factor (OMF) lipoprotein